MPPATTSAGALGALQSAQAAQVTPEQAQQQANDALGVNAAQQTVTGLRGAIQRTTSLLNNVAPSVYGRTENSLVTSAQAGRQIANEQAPIQQDLSKNTADFTNAENDYKDLEGKAQAQASAKLADQGSRLSFLQQVYQNLYGQEQDAAKAAEQKRQFDATLAETAASRKASAASSFSPSFGGGSSSTVGSIGRDKAGGYQITGPTGSPITLGQYAAMNGLQSGWIAQQLMQSGNANDQKVAAAINSGKYSSQQLRQMFPQALGGSY